MIRNDAITATTIYAEHQTPTANSKFNKSEWAINTVKREARLVKNKNTNDHGTIYRKEKEKLNFSS